MISIEIKLWINQIFSAQTAFPALLQGHRRDGETLSKHDCSPAAQLTTGPQTGQ